MKILAAIDLHTAGHEWLVEQALNFAHAHGGTVDLLFVGNDAKANDKLRDLLDAGPEAVRGQTLVRTGSALSVIVDTSADYDALVMGPRVHGALERFVLGTMAARVIRAARCATYVPRVERAHKPGERPRMLVGVDMSSKNPGWVVGKAAVWAQRVNGRLDAIFADPHGLPYIGEQSIREAAQQQWLKHHEPIRLKLEGLIEVTAKNNRGRAKIAEGEPESVLVEMSSDYDLVLLGTRERSGIAGLVLGSVAEHVVQHSKCDVLTLPSNVLDAV